MGEELDGLFQKVLASVDEETRAALKEAGAYLFMAPDDAREELRRFRGEVNQIVRDVEAEAEEARRERAQTIREWNEAKGRVAAQVIESLMPVCEITNQVPADYLAIVERYIRKMFAPTDEQIKETFEIEHRKAERLQRLQARVHGLEMKRNEALDRLDRARREVEIVGELLREDESPEDQSKSG